MDKTITILERKKSLKKSFIVLLCLVCLILMLCGCTSNEVETTTELNVETTDDDGWNQTMIDMMGTWYADDENSENGRNGIQITILKNAVAMSVMLDGEVYKNGTSYMNLTQDNGTYYFEKNEEKLFEVSLVGEKLHLKELTYHEYHFPEYYYKQ